MDRHLCDHQCKQRRVDVSVTGSWQPSQAVLSAQEIGTVQERYHSGDRMIVRIPQRTQDDCAICAIAMVMGHPYSYERVLADSARYSNLSSEGNFFAWWETYFRDEGFDGAYCRFDGLGALGMYGGDVVGMLGLDIPHLNRGHIVA